MALCSSISLYLDSYGPKKSARTGSDNSDSEDINRDENTDEDEDHGERIVQGSDCENEPPCPFIVSVQRKNRHLCVGTLVAIDWVLTAAHCGNGSVGLKCVIGKPKLSYAPTKDIDYSVIHPGFNRVTLRNDIQLLHLQVPVHNVQLAYFPLGFYDVDYTLVCKTGMVMGWGIKENNKYELAEDLQCVTLDTIPQHQCAQMHHKKLEGNMCTVSATKGPNLGDSGGPLMCGNVQYGFVSWGWSCGTNLPVVYTSINYHLEFILRTINYENQPDIYDEMYPEMSSESPPFHPSFRPPTVPGIITTRTTPRITTRFTTRFTTIFPTSLIPTIGRPQIPVLNAGTSKSYNCKIAVVLFIILNYLF